MSEAFVSAQSDSTAAPTTFGKAASDLRLGPVDFHPRLSAGMTYDDNIELSTADKEADVDWMIQPAVQAVAGDDAALIAYRDQNNIALSLLPGNLIIQPPEDRPGRLFVLDYGPRFQFFDKYTGNNSVDEFASLEILWPLNKLILGFRQDYQSQKLALIEASLRTKVEFISSALSAAYQFGEKTSLESDFRRFSYSYETPGLVGYTEYNTEDWFNYQLTQKVNTSLGVLAGWDSVPGHEDQTFEQLRARARYLFSEKLAFDVSVGGELRQYENGKAATLTPVFTLSGLYRLRERTRLGIYGGRQPYAAIINGYNYTTTTIGVDVRQEITDRFAAELSVSYTSLEYAPVSGPSTSHTDGYFIPRMNFEAKIYRHLTGVAFYQYFNRQSGFNGALTDDQVGIQLALSY